MKKQIYIVIAAVLITVALGWKCFLSQKVTLTFINDSSINIDSVVFSMNNYKCKMQIMKLQSKTAITIYPDSIRLNNHDVIVRAYLYIKDSLFRGASNYNDLYGGLDKGYKLILKADSTTQLTSEN